MKNHVGHLVVLISLLFYSTCDAGEFRRVAALTLNQDEGPFTSAGIDEVHGYAYFGTATNPSRIVKVRLGYGDNPPERIGSITMASGENQLRAGVVDGTSGYGYFGTLNGQVIKIRLGEGDLPPLRLGTLTLGSREGGLRAAVIDRANGYAWFGSGDPAGGLVKIALGEGDALPVRIGNAPLGTGVWNLGSGVIDLQHNCAYFGTAFINDCCLSPAKIIKFTLGIGAAPPTNLGSIDLSTGEDNLWNGAIIDPANGYAYFGTGTQPRIVVKTRLGAGNSLPTRVGALTLNSGEGGTGSAGAAVIDPTRGFGYFASTTYPAVVTRIFLGLGDGPPQRISAITLEADEANLQAGVIDVERGYAYFGAATNPGKVIKMALDTTEPSCFDINGDGVFDSADFLQKLLRP